MASSMKKKNNLEYFKKDDAIFFCIKEGLEYESVEVAPDVTVELGKNNEIIGIEMLNASKHFRKNIISSLSKRSFLGTDLKIKG